MYLCTWFKEKSVLQSFRFKVIIRTATGFVNFSCIWLKINSTSSSPAQFEILKASKQAEGPTQGRDILQETCSGSFESQGESDKKNQQIRFRMLWLLAFRDAQPCFCSFINCTVVFFLECPWPVLILPLTSTNAKGIQLEYAYLGAKCQHYSLRFSSLRLW